jgi:hypothetical protein
LSAEWRLVPPLLGSRHFDAFAAERVDQQAAERDVATHMLCCNCRMYFSAAASSEKVDQQIKPVRQADNPLRRRFRGHEEVWGFPR